MSETADEQPAFEIKASTSVRGNGYIYIQINATSEQIIALNPSFEIIFSFPEVLSDASSSLTHSLTVIHLEPVGDSNLME
ncbi:hypothetical protein QE109_12670 [Fusibacter bizertensis]|uniref:Uncharacterized protein n=1 Tax=Fusibacter bizertensis TaxID=1488331 RepID=A0ABT6NF09_9FIRM|nr:hypothetical protein [Fusibacter bizertensis]MDH8679006.1 hypothetical protein [Fusibacter bizertensis]